MEQAVFFNAATAKKKKIFQRNFLFEKDILNTDLRCKTENN